MAADSIRPEEYRPKWTFRRIVIWASIFYALSACAGLSYSFSREALAGTADVSEIAGYCTLIIAHIGMLVLLVFQYVWGVTAELKDFFSLLQNAGRG